MRDFASLEKKNSTYQFQLEIADIEVELAEVVAVSGYKKDDIPIGMEKTIIDIYDRFIEKAEPQAGFRLLDKRDFKHVGNGVILDGVRFVTGRIIASKLLDLEGCALFAATLGSQFDTWIEELTEKDDIYAAYFADLIAAEYIEKLLLWTEREIKKKIAGDALLTNRYAPGYCEWDLREQEKIFQLFPSEFCGISLTEHLMMCPKKSISGLLGYGVDVVASELPCDRCMKFNCHNNKNFKRFGV